MSARNLLLRSRVFGEQKVIKDYDRRMEGECDDSQFRFGQTLANTESCLGESIVVVAENTRISFSMAK